MNAAATLDYVLRHKLVAVVRSGTASPAELASIVDAIADGGIRVIEITLTTPGALQFIEKLAARPDILVGAGSVLTTGDALNAFQAGAAFYASPIYDERVTELALSMDRVAMPGAFTPTEAARAWAGGADIVKLFPTPPDGPAYLKSLLAPMPYLRLAPSGGVTADTVRPLLAAGAAALNVGQWLTHDPDGERSTHTVIRERASVLAYAASTSAQ